MLVVEAHGVHHLMLDVPHQMGALPDGYRLWQRERPIRATDLGETRAAVQEFNVRGLHAKKLRGLG